MGSSKRAPKIGNSNIGTKGGTGFASNSGGQKPFLPSREEYNNGGKGGASVTGGSSSNDDPHSSLSSSDTPGFSHLPKSRPSGIRKS